MYGIDVSFGAADWVQIYKSADEELEEIFGHCKDQVNDFKGIVTADIQFWKFTAPEEERIFSKMKCLLHLSRTHFSRCTLLLDLGRVSSPRKPEPPLKGEESQGT
jgi:hypothetical protein